MADCGYFDWRANVPAVVEEPVAVVEEPVVVEPEPVAVVEAAPATAEEPAAPVAAAVFPVDKPYEAVEPDTHEVPGTKGKSALFSGRAIGAEDELHSRLPIDERPIKTNPKPHFSSEALWWTSSSYD